jgi:hypothetical protein
MGDELERMGKKTGVAFLKYCPDGAGGTEKTH